MSYTLQIQKILLSIENVSDIGDKINLQKQAIAIADSNNDLDWGYELRGDLMYLEKGSCYCIDSFPVFTWLLDIVDSNPDLFEENDVLAKYRWMLIAAQKNTGFSLDQIHNIRDDYKRRMLSNGHGLYTFYNEMFRWHMSIGELAKAQEFQILRDNEQPDNISYCQACSTNQDVEFELLSGNWDKAIALAEEVLSNRQTCFYEPFSVLAKIVYYLYLAKDSRAEEYYLRAEEVLSTIDTSESYLMQLMSYLLFYTSYNHRERAWELFEQLSGWDVKAQDYTSFYFAMNVLPLLKEKSKKQLNLSSHIPYFENDGVYDTESLYNYYLSQATSLSKQFDERNGNTYFSDILDRVVLSL